MAPFSAGCLVRNEWVCGEYVRTRRSELEDSVTQHITLTVVAVLIGLVVAIPLAVLARRLHLRQVLLGSATVIYTIPSVALFSFFIPFTGISATTVSEYRTRPTTTVVALIPVKGMKNENSATDGIV